MSAKVKEPVIILGADPELFVYDTKKEKLSTAIAFFPGGKRKGERLAQIPGASVLHDNVAVEFNCRPYSTADDFVDGMGSILSNIQKLLAERATEHHKLVCNVGSAIFDSRLLRHKDAKTFGCEPDINAWSSMRNAPPQPHEVGNLRVIGGHLHIGMRGANGVVDSLLRSFTGSCALVKLLDATLGQYIAYLESKSPAKQTFIDRRAWYGAAGSMRKKPYGVEYRTPSAIWLESRESIERVFNITAGVMAAVAEESTDDAEAVVHKVTREGNTHPLYTKLLDEANLCDADVVNSVNLSAPQKGLLDYALSF